MGIKLSIFFNYPIPLGFSATPGKIFLMEGEGGKTASSTGGSAHGGSCECIIHRKIISF